MLVKEERNLEWVGQVGEKLQIEGSFSHRSYFILLTYLFKNFSRRQTQQNSGRAFPRGELSLQSQ